MKKGKMVLSLLVTVIALFMFVGCTENAALMDSLLRTSDNFSAVSYSYDSNENESINNVRLTSLSNTEYYTMKLSDDGTNDLIEFNEMRLELIAIHQEILVEIDAIKTLVDSIKTRVQVIKDMDYILLQGDEDIIKANIVTITEYRDALLETQGQAYQRITDLNGSYTRENLPEILVVFGEVYQVLQFRLDTLRLGIIEFENIDQILSDYMEN